jgi:hypothetical protein
MTAAYDALRDFSGNPIMVQTQQGQYLRNYLTGNGERADLSKPLSHFLTAVGKVGRPFQDEAHQTQDQRGGWSNWANRKLPAGLWFADGDAHDVADADPIGRLVYYDEQRLRQARLDSFAEVGLKATPHWRNEDVGIRASQWLLSRKWRRVGAQRPARCDHSGRHPHGIPRVSLRRERSSASLSSGLPLALEEVMQGRAR